MAGGLVAVDTDLLIDFLRGRGPGQVVTRALIGAGQLRVTTVTAFELRVGTDFHARSREIMRIFRGRTLPLDLSAALQAGEVAAHLRRLGTPIGAPDTLIAGICLHHDLPLATRNIEHFGRVPGLALQAVT